MRLFCRFGSVVLFGHFIRSSHPSVHMCVCVCVMGALYEQVTRLRQLLEISGFVGCIVTGMLSWHLYLCTTAQTSVEYRGNQFRGNLLKSEDGCVYGYHTQPQLHVNDKRKRIGCVTGTRALARTHHDHPHAPNTPCRGAQAYVGAMEEPSRPPRDGGDLPLHTGAVAEPRESLRHKQPRVDACAEPAPAVAPLAAARGCGGGWSSCWCTRSRQQWGGWGGLC